MIGPDDFLLVVTKNAVPVTVLLVGLAQKEKQLNLDI
jgi:hypothetical protein